MAQRRRPQHPSRELEIDTKSTRVHADTHTCQHVHKKKAMLVNWRIHMLCDHLTFCLAFSSLWNFPFLL